MTTEERLQNLEAAVGQMVERYWRFQGWMNALEMVVCADVMNLAKMQPRPFEWIQAYLAAMRQSASTLTPDVDNQAKGARLTRETRHALDEFLSGLVEQAGQLPGAPARE
ncbi:hypothetical protein [Bradyrhizobium sp. SZCCHNS2015]|uniref:hypothetical protein n=1 Tax=Bradyrhizobium sp. SZCCHNS2015 TaxID=3057305 RepID=UPI0028E9B6FD|nr:hypothetical protein [Bradyrhizobium sp. SZCCHNS2015]